MSRCARLQVPALDDQPMRQKLLAALAYPQEMLWNCNVITPIERPPTRSTGLNFQIHQGSSLGDLQILPVELLDIVFQFSDLQSLFHFLRLNTLAYNVVKKSPTVSTLTKHALEALLVLSRTGAAFYFTASQLLDVLCRSDCVLCGRAGFLLYLPECVRCCFVCIQKAELDLMPKAEAVATFGLTKRSMSVLPTITLPRKRPSKLVSARLAREAAISQHGGENSLAAYVKSKKKQARANKKSRWATPQHRQMAFRSWAVLPFPYFERGTGVAHSGVLCLGCNAVAVASSFNWGEGYTEENFFRHIAHECVGAWNLWNSYDRNNFKIA